MNNQGKSITIKQNVPFKGGMDLYPKNTQSIKFKMAELQDIIVFKMGDIRTIARLKLGNIAHLKKQLTSVYFLRPSLSTIVPQRI